MHCMGRKDVLPLYCGNSHNRLLEPNHQWHWRSIQRPVEDKMKEKHVEDVCFRLGPEIFVFTLILLDIIDSKI